MMEWYSMKRASHHQTNPGFHQSWFWVERFIDLFCSNMCHVSRSPKMLWMVWWCQYLRPWQSLGSSKVLLWIPGWWSCGDEYYIVILLHIIELKGWFLRIRKFFWKPKMTWHLLFTLEVCEAQRWFSPPIAAVCVFFLAPQIWATSQHHYLLGWFPFQEFPGSQASQIFCLEGCAQAEPYTVPPWHLEAKNHCTSWQGKIPGLWRRIHIFYVRLAIISIGIIELPFFPTAVWSLYSWYMSGVGWLVMGDEEKGILPNNDQTFPRFHPWWDFTQLKMKVISFSSLNFMVLCPFTGYGPLERSILSTESWSHGWQCHSWMRGTSENIAFLPEVFQFIMRSYQHHLKSGLPVILVKSRLVIFIYIYTYIYIWDFSHLALWLRSLFVTSNTPAVALLAPTARASLAQGSTPSNKLPCRCRLPGRPVARAAVDSSPHWIWNPHFACLGEKKTPGKKFSSWGPNKLLQKGPDISRYKGKDIEESFPSHHPFRGEQVDFGGEKPFSKLERSRVFVFCSFFLSFVPVW